MHNSENICFLLLPTAVGIAFLFLIGLLCVVLKIGHFRKVGHKYPKGIKTFNFMFEFPCFIS